MVSEDTSGRVHSSENRALRRLLGRRSEPGYFPEICAQNEAMKGLEMGSVGCRGPMVPGWEVGPPGPTMNKLFNFAQIPL